MPSAPRIPVGSGWAARCPTVKAVPPDSVVMPFELPAEDPAEDPRPGGHSALALRLGASCIGRPEEHALQADPTRPGEAVEHQLACAAGQEAGLEAHDLLVHLDGVV